jgi:hypothetical protein
MATQRRAQEKSGRFAKRPTAGTHKAMQTAWRAHHRVARPKSVYTAIMREAGAAFVREERAKGLQPGEATNLARTPRRRLLKAQRDGHLPDVIYRDDTEASWWPRREKLRIRMIDRSEFDAWPARVPAARPKARRPPPPPRGDLARHTDPSPRLAEVLEERRLYRMIILIIQAATTDPAVAQALHHLRAQAARVRR